MRCSRCLGMMLFLASNDLITMFVSLEILSLPLYLLCGLARRRRLLSQEAALKYFLLGALSSAFFIYGAALLYGYSGSFTLSAIDDAIRTGAQGQGLLLAGMALLGVGLLFKFSAVPFHSWTPDVYAGAPTPVTGFMAACTKIAAVGALMRVFYVGLGADRWDWQPMMAIITVATMAVGSVLAITQTDVKRMLAYSSIAHAGFMMTAFVGASQAVTGSQPGSLTSISSVMFYLVAYGAATIGAFALVTMVRDPSGEATLLNSWIGLGRRAPLAATIFSIFMLSFAGIPLTSGFVGKWAVFAAAWSGGIRVACCRGGGDQRRGGLLLYPRYRADVLCRAESHGNQRDTSWLDHAHGGRRWAGRDGSLRGVSGPAIGPRAASR